MNPGTPLAERRLTILVQELAPEAPFNDHVASALIDALDRNPWRPFTEMQSTVDDPWQTYRREAALGCFQQQRRLRLRIPGEPLFDGSLACSKHANTVRLSMQLPDYENGGASTVEQWIAQILAALPHRSCASASADDDQMMFIRDRKLPSPPEPLDSVGWLQVIYPSAYRDTYDRDVLLAAPCHRIEERDDGSIWIWAYADPFHYDTPVARDTNAALRVYLSKHSRP